jgi:hypothetical protein
MKTIKKEEMAFWAYLNIIENSSLNGVDYFLLQQNNISFDAPCSHPPSPHLGLVQ